MESKKSERKYEKPKITTYTEDDIFELVGPVQTINSIGLDHGNHFGWGKGKGNPH